MKIVTRSCVYLFEAFPAVLTPAGEWWEREYSIPSQGSKW